MEKIKLKVSEIDDFLERRVCESVYKETKEAFPFVDLDVNYNFLKEINLNIYDYDYFKYVMIEKDNKNEVNYIFQEDILEKAIYELLNYEIFSNFNMDIYKIFKDFKNTYIFDDGIEMMLLTAFKFIKEQDDFKVIEDIFYGEGMGNSVFIQEQNKVYGCLDSGIPYLPSIYKKIIAKTTLNEDILFFANNKFEKGELNDIKEDIQILDIDNEEN